MRYIFTIIIILFSHALIADTLSPYITPLYPTADMEGIPVNSDITFQISDDEDGVDIESVQVNIDGIIYTSISDLFFYSGTAENFTITINPPMNFPYNATINIQIDATDQAEPANEMDSYIYSFQTVADFQPPYIGNLIPAAESFDVPHNTNINFNVYDSGIGVNLNSIAVDVNGISYTQESGYFTFSLIESGYQITIDVPGNFALNETVEVSINASDLNGIAMATFDYSFSILDDILPPFTGEWTPSPNSIEISLDTNISFNIYDNIEGVDIESLVVTIQGNQYTHLNTTLDYTPLSNGFSVIIDPINDFNYDEEVSVQIDCSDLSQNENIMPTYSYTFQCKDDNLPPYLGNFYPEPGAENIQLDSDITLHVFDEDTGVDINTLLIDIEGIEYSIAAGNLSYSGVTSDYSITINPIDDFALAQTVTVEITVSDLSSPTNTLFNFSYSFQCVDDTQPPYVINVSPAPNSTDVELTTNISFHILDSRYGVDINSVIVDINSIIYSVTNNNLFFSGNVNEYLIIIDPEEDFDSGEEVSVSIEATDLANPSHTMNSFNFSFDCLVEDVEPPFIYLPIPANGDVNVSINSEIQFYVLDQFSGVNLQSIELSINNTSIDNFDSQPVTIMENSGFEISFIPSEPFDYDQIVTVQISAEDLAAIPNILNNVSYSFSCEGDEQSPYITEIIPAPNSSDNSVETNISFHILDDGYGVDINSIIVNFDGANYSSISSNFSYSGNVNNYYISIVPLNILPSGETINVTIDGADLANPSQSLETVEYSFHTIFIDDQAPFIWQPFPTDGSTNVPISTAINCYILDASSNVNPTSIELKINDSEIDNFELEPIELLESSGYLLSYLSENQFDFNQAIAVSISASDLATIPNTLIDEIFSFVCSNTTPPTIDLPDSFTSEEDLSFAENISFYFTNLGNIELILGVSECENIDIYIDNFIATFTPNENWYGTENVTFSLFDTEGTLLVSDDTYIEFTAKNDPPIFDPDLFPTQIEFIENETKTIDFSYMIIDPEQELSELTLSIIGNEYISVEITNFSVTFSAETGWTGTETVTIILNDGISRAASETDLDITVSAEVSEERIEISPHTVSWTDPSCEIKIFTQIDKNNISGKILDKRGKLITKLNIEDFGNNKKAIWNKKNSHGNKVNGGFYIYQIKINTRVYQGSIIIAR